MKIKRKLFTFILSVAFIFTMLCGTNLYAVAGTSYLFVGGMPAGFTIKTNGAEVIGISEIAVSGEVISPAKSADIKIGDIITEIDKQKICGADSVAEVLNNSKGEPLEIKVVRNGEEITKYLTPKKDGNGNYKLGLFLREDLCGIGTVTYFTEKGNFVALGHPVLNENGDFLDVRQGSSFLCSVIGFDKGGKGRAGELKGIFMHDQKIGCINYNSNTGIYGEADKNYKFNSLPKAEIGNAQMGKASILTCIDGVSPNEYEINIVKIDEQNKHNKNFVIKITDKDLLNQTGGILQGMSGSPIIQNGKIVGAITHVFINDPTRGYGISIYKMIKNQK